jgi:uncharacterized protein YjbJ (UPF0337 family)
MLNHLVKQVQGRVQELWSGLIEYEIPEISGDRDRLVRAIQEQLGYTREKAEEMISRRFPR